MAHKIWVGKRESDILTYKFFDTSITFWGSNTNGNFSFCVDERKKDNYGSDFLKFVVNKIYSLIKQYSSNVEIHFYNNSLAYKIIRLDSSLKKYIVNINSQRIFDIVRHKTLSRVWLQNTVCVPDFIYLSKDECQYSQLIKLFPKYSRFVIQKSLSGGGDGTFLMDENNWYVVYETLEKSDIYLVSPYYEDNRSFSCHLLITNCDVIVFPISEQLLNYSKQRISYCGNKYLRTSEAIYMKIREMASKIGSQLMSIDYRGICGLDFIQSDNHLMLIEINPRYQGSSYIMNASLREHNLPSLFELNKMCFKSNISSDIKREIQNLQICYESHVCSYEEGWTPSAISCPSNATLFLDGVQNAQNFAEDVYLYRYLVNL